MTSRDSFANKLAITTVVLQVVTITLVLVLTAKYSWMGAIVGLIVSFGIDMAGFLALKKSVQGSDPMTDDLIATLTSAAAVMILSAVLAVIGTIGSYMVAKKSQESLILTVPLPIVTVGLMYAALAAVSKIKV